MRSRKLAALAGALVLTAPVTAGCAVGADDTDYSGGGTALEPTMGTARGKHRGAADDRARDKVRDGTRSGSGRGDAVEEGRGDADGAAEAQQAGAAASPESTTGHEGEGQQPAGAPPARDASASVRDGRGDASGVGAPAYVDLVGADLTRTGRALTLTVTSAAAFPAGQDGSRTTNVIGFFDVDGDGAIDYEAWATLSDNGWSATWRHPDGARFGSDSGIGVSASGNQVTLRFNADHVGGADTFGWVVGAEDGSLEQVSTGTSARDYAPDSGAAAFPAR